MARTLSRAPSQLGEPLMDLDEVDIVVTPEGVIEMIRPRARDERIRRREQRPPEPVGERSSRWD